MRVAVEEFSEEPDVVVSGKSVAVRKLIERGKQFLPWRVLCGIEFALSADETYVSLCVGFIARE